MVANMMKWRPWPQPAVRKFQVKLKVHRLEGLRYLLAGKSGELGIPSSCSNRSGELGKLIINVNWKGSKSSLRSRLGRLKRMKTTEKLFEDNAVVNWEEEFEHLCVLSMSKNGQCLPWEVHFVITQVGAKNKVVVLGDAVMNLPEFISTADHGKQTTKLRILTPTGSESQSALMVSLSFVDLRTRENLGFDCFGPLLCNLDDQQLVGQAVENRVGKLEVLTSANGQGNSRELGTPPNGVVSPKSEENSDNSRESFGSYSVDDWEEEELMTGDDHHIQCYKHLAGVNLLVEGALPYCRERRCGEDHALPACHRATLESLLKEAQQVDQIASQSSMRSILTWRKRKLSFRSPRGKSEPLLNKDYGEDGGDDIDFDRRLSSSPNELVATSCQCKENGALSPNLSGCLDFGEEDFAVGNWERKDLISRDGQSKISADVFFATIDQRNERAAGESACTALVAVIANWLHQNPTRMPIKAEFDTLIREGSAEWRKLCYNESYKDRFPDKHFDLDTVLQAKVRPIRTTPDRSFVGFFQPEGICDFLQGSMSFDDIWEEVVSKKTDDSFEPAIYIVSWNDHFFVLKVEKDKCHIIDTLGARLYEGCSQAYILCFDNETTFCHVSKSEGTSEDDKSSLSQPSKVGSTPVPAAASCSSQQIAQTDEGGVVKQIEKVGVFIGKDACKEFIKGFFAALILRELEGDLKKGLLGNVPLHHRLQVEFHFTSSEST